MTLTLNDLVHSVRDKVVAIFLFLHARAMATTAPCQINSQCCLRPHAWGPVPVPLEQLKRIKRLTRCRVSMPNQSDPIIKGLKQMAKYLAPTVATIRGTLGDAVGFASLDAKQQPAQEEAVQVETIPEVATDDWQSPVYSLIVVNVLVFVIMNLLHPLPAGWLQLGLGKSFNWWQVVTSGFVTSGLDHLAETTFFIYTFGRLLERAHGATGLWISYLGGVIGANSLAIWLFPVRASGSIASASAGALAMCVAGLVWPRLARKPLEVVCLTPMVLMATVARFQALSPLLTVDGVRVGHLVHVVGSLVGASVISGVFAVTDWVLAKMEEERLEKERLEAEARKAEAPPTPSVSNEAVKEVLGTVARVAATQIVKTLL